MTKPPVDRFSPDSVPDPETWERYRRVIGKLEWEWKPSPNQPDVATGQQLGQFTFRIRRTTDTGELILPEGTRLNSIVKVLEWLTTDNPSQPNRPQLLNIDSEAGANIIVTCKNHEISSQIALSGGSSKTTHSNKNSDPVIEAPKNVLYDVVFYRSGNGCNQLYCFVPQPIKPAEVQKKLKEQSIKLVNGLTPMRIANRSGSRIQIDEEKTLGAVEKLQDLNIEVLLSPPIELPQASMPVAGMVRR